jgi:hypothetical protein
MSTVTNYPPTTAYEALKAFFPGHEGHTVSKAAFYPSYLEILCNCSDARLAVSEEMAAAKKWKLRDVRNALRNVGTLPPLPR